MKWINPEARRCWDKNGKPTNRWFGEIEREDGADTCQTDNDYATETEALFRAKHLLVQANA